MKLVMLGVLVLNLCGVLLNMVFLKLIFLIILLLFRNGGMVLRCLCWVYRVLVLVGLYILWLVMV